VTTSYTFPLESPQHDEAVKFRQPKFYSRLGQGYPNPGRQLALAAKFCTIALNICGF